MVNEAVWSTVRLESVTDEVTVGYVGPMTSEYQITGIPFLRSKNIKPFTIDTGDIRYISDEFHYRIRKSTLRPGDVVIVRTGAPGITAVIPEWLKEANCSDLVIVRPNSSLNPYYLAYFMNAVAQHQVFAHTVGAVQQHFNVGSAKQLLLPLPPREEQDGIVQLLRAFDCKIELNHQMNQTLEAIAQSVFKSWFVDFDPVTAKMAGRASEGMTADTAALFPSRFIKSELGLIPEGWKAGKIGDVGKNPRIGVRPNEVSPDTPYIGLEHIPRKAITLSEWGKAIDVTSGKFKFKTGEILFGKLRPYFHKVGVAPVDGVCSTDVLVVNAVMREWFGILLGHLSSIEFINYVDSASGGTRMPRTDWDIMARYDIIVPKQEVASRHTQFVEDLIAKTQANIFESRTLTALRDSLLPKLLAGEIRVSQAEKVVAEAV